jgi:hypothetical protein
MTVMNNDNLPCDPALSPIADIMRHRSDRSVYWTGRELMLRLGYNRWRDFSRFIAKAMSACVAQGHDPIGHFRFHTVNKRNIKDCILTHYGAYLTAMAANPYKGAVAAVQRGYRELLGAPLDGPDEASTGDIRKLRETILEAIAQAPPGTSPFDVIRHLTPEGIEYWEARELLSFLGYIKWQNMQEVVERARLACENSGYNSVEHFTDVSKVFHGGQGATYELDDFRLSRLACYFVAMNGDATKKEEVALAQRYFVSATRAYELGVQAEPEAEKAGADGDKLAEIYRLLMETGRAGLEAHERQKLLERKHEGTEDRVDRLVDVVEAVDDQLQQVSRDVHDLRSDREDTRHLLREIERAAEPPAPLPLRAKVRRLVECYAEVYGRDYGDVWRWMYRELKDRYHYDAERRAEHSGQSALSHVERDGHLEDLWRIASELLK